jgi:hypothetical protein
VETVTNNEKELVAALEGDIQTWQVEADFFERSVTEIDVIGNENISGKDYARGLRLRIAKHRALIEKVKKVDVPESRGIRRLLSETNFADAYYQRDVS